MKDAGDPILQRYFGVTQRRLVKAIYRRSRPSASGLDPEGEGRRKINQITVRTVDTVRNPQRRVKNQRGEGGKIVRDDISTSSSRVCIVRVWGTSVRSLAEQPIAAHLIQSPVRLPA